MNFGAEGYEGTEWMLAQQRQFAADASHELRTPLAGLRAQLEEAQLHPGETDLPELLNAALRDVGRLEAIIADLLLLARVADSALNEREPVDLAETVRAEVGRQVGGLEVRLRLEPGVIVNAIADQIGLLLANLLHNAQRHANHTIEVWLRRTDTHAELLVCDDGAGVAAQDRERIFECFARLDKARSRDFGGTGLGLAIAHGIAHAHQGTLQVEDVCGDGACFVLRLPLAQPSITPPHTA